MPTGPTPPDKPGPPDSKRRPAAPTRPYVGPGPASAPADSGYDSERDDPPQNYYEGQARDRDRKRGGTALERKARRKEARDGWTPIPTRLASYVREERYRYQQSAFYPTCMASCAAFICLREIGFTVPVTMHIIKTMAATSGFSVWQRDYGDRHDEVAERFEAGQSDVSINTVHAELLSTVAAGIDLIADRYADRLSPDNARRLRDRIHTSANLPAIYFTRIIGTFPAVGWHDREESHYWFSTAHSRKGNTVVDMPHPPSSRPMPTMQSTLFNGYQPAIKRTLPHPDKKMAQPLSRTATPFVILGIAAVDVYGEGNGHAVVVDFSDPDRPGIFDPNFGWLEPAQGFCILTLEQALYAIWHNYTHAGSRDPTRQAMRYLPTDSPDLRIYAEQVYIQSPLPPPAPPKRGLRK